MYLSCFGLCFVRMVWLRVLLVSGTLMALIESFHGWPVGVPFWTPIHTSKGVGLFVAVTVECLFLSSDSVHYSCILCHWARCSITFPLPDNQQFKWPKYVVYSKASRQHIEFLLTSSCLLSKLPWNHIFLTHHMDEFLFFTIPYTGLLWAG